MATWTPMDLRLAVSEELPASKVFKWGICGTGRVCHDFVQALKNLRGAEVTCASARSAEKAATFASLHKIPQSYGSFLEMAERGDFDIMYVGTLHPFHHEHAEAALRAGKHVVVEKPFTMSHKEAQSLASLAARENVFLCEGIWTRYFPAVEEARRRIADGQIGEVVQVVADFCVNASDDGDGPDDGSDFFKRELGGGCANYVTIYPLQAVVMCLGGDPISLTVGGSCNKSGVDVHSTTVLCYEGHKVGVVISNTLAEGTERTEIVGTKGRIVIETPAHCPTRFTLTQKFEGRLQVENSTLEFPLPEEAPEVRTTGGWYYPNSIGFQYEAAAVMRLIASGKTDTPQYPMDEVLAVHKLLDRIRNELSSH